MRDSPFDFAQGKRGDCPYMRSDELRDLRDLLHLCHRVVHAALHLVG
jgi:hypothetical protein